MRSPARSHFIVVVPVIEVGRAEMGGGVDIVAGAAAVVVVVLVLPSPPVPPLLLCWCWVVHESIKHLKKRRGGTYLPSLLVVVCMNQECK